MAENEKNTVENEVHYSWVGYPSDLPEEERQQIDVSIGGDTTFVFAEVINYSDGSMALKLVSNGIDSRYALTQFMSSVTTIVQHDYLETQKDERE